MKRRDTFILIAMALAAGAAAFGVGRVVTLRQRGDATGPQAQWLQGAAPEAVQAEQRFEQQARQRMDEVRAQQAVLASMLPDTRCTGAQILTQAARIAQSYAGLARSVGGHVAHLQRILPQVQEQRVMQCCASSLRGGLQRRYRWRGGAQGAGFPGGRGGGWGRGEGGQGAGYGRQYRGGRNSTDSLDTLDRRLRLTPEQNGWVRQNDPNFPEQCLALRDGLYQASVELAAGFENAGMTAQELATKVDRLIAAHEALEKRVAEHVVLLRPQLSPEQRELLADLFRGNVSSEKDAAVGRHHPDDSPLGFRSGEILGYLLVSLDG